MSCLRSLPWSPRAFDLVGVGNGEVTLEPQNTKTRELIKFKNFVPLHFSLPFFFVLSSVIEFLSLQVGLINGTHVS